MTAGRAASLWAAMVFPSLAIVEKYLGWPAVAVYAIGAALVLRFSGHLPHFVPRRRVFALACATWILVTVVFLAVHPMVNSRDTYTGSDDDDAHDLGVTALFAGESPYTQTTYLGNHLHQLPGAYVLAAPFVIMGTSALQNLFWLPLFFVAIARHTRDPRGALALAWLVLAFNPELMHQVVTGTGYSSNAISVLLSLWWLVRTNSPTAAIVWGVALAARANFLLLIPLAFAPLYRRVGMRTSVQLIGLTCATVAALSLPFYFNDPASFGPLEPADRLLRFDVLLPNAGLILLALNGAVAISLAWTQAGDAALFRSCAAVLALPVFAGLLLSSWADGQLNFEYTPYGLFFSWFLLVDAFRADEAAGPVLRG